MLLLRDQELPRVIVKDPLINSLRRAKEPAFLRNITPATRRRRSRETMLESLSFLCRDSASTPKRKA